MLMRCMTFPKMLGPFVSQSMLDERMVTKAADSDCRKLPLKEENGKEGLKPDLIEIKVHTDNSIHTKQDDSKA